MTKPLSRMTRFELEQHAWVWQSRAADDYEAAQGFLKRGRVAEAVRCQRLAADAGYIARQALFRLLGAELE